MAGKSSGNEQQELLADRIKAKIALIDVVANELPGVIIINNIQENGAVVYMSPKGLQQLGITLEELQKKAGMEYHAKFFNPDDAKEYVPKIFALLERNNSDESVSFFQQVRTSADSDFVWHMSNVKIFMRDDAGKPLLCLVTSHAIEPDHELTNKVSRLLDQNNFLKKNYNLYAKLSKRERQLLKMIVLGKSSAEIAQELFISVTTVETHRRNIKQKLKTSTSYELTQYAQAFDLI